MQSICRESMHAKIEDTLISNYIEIRIYMGEQELKELNDWQLKEIREGLEEADRGKFVSDMEIEKIFVRWDEAILPKKNY